jgi:hypothetical protein
MKRMMGLVVALLPSLALAQEMPPPAAELSTEKWFVGKWTCEGTQHASPMGPEHKYTAGNDFKMDLGGYWLSYAIDYVKPQKMMFLKGVATWDPGQKKHVRVDYMVGGSWAQMTTPGWEGDKLVFTGETVMGGKKMSMRHTITKSGDAQFSGLYEVGGPDGKLMPLFEESCKKKK